MSANESFDPVAPLREAVRVSPTNVPLRQHFAETLLTHGHAPEAEKEFREALAMSPNNASLKVGLARAFMAQKKNSHALALIEDVVKEQQAPARAFILHARLLLELGESQQAVYQYRRAIESDPTVADTALAERLGINADEDSEVVDGRVRSTWEGDDEGGPNVDLEKPALKFADVGGMDKLKEEIQLKIILPLTKPELYKAYGKKTGGGILMYGPPGCGKTYLARATAGEINASFISVGINEVLDMWIGGSERNLHELFENARAHTPCVLFFDEVDALGANRSDMRQSSGRLLINQFLAELDGVKDSNEGVLILAATNAPWHLDAAFRRPGRFDRILFVPPPDRPARASILQLHLAGKPVQDVDHDHLAKKTEGFSGADLKGVVDVCVENKLREALKAGVPKPITTKDLVAAAEQTKQSTKEWFSTAKNYALYSNQGGTYDEILAYLKMK
ncbi:MAG TPA: AAA family ATPase [Verrucomicrobiae bacterium]